MNPDRQQSLLRAARRVPPVPPPEHFCAEVLRTIQRNDPAAASPGSVFAVLDGWFPRLALTAALIILAMGVFDYYVDGDVVTQLSATSEAWLPPEEWL